MHRQTPIRALVRGLVASAIGTAVMDMVLFARYRRGGSESSLAEPIWKYDVKTLANDLSAHLVYGLGTAAAMRALSS